MAKSKIDFSPEREKDLLERAEFQSKCCLHWISECENLLKEFDLVSKRLDKYDVDDYTLDLNKSKKIDALLKKQEELHTKINRHLAKSKIEKEQLDKIEKEAKDFSLFKLLLTKSRKKRKK